MPKKSTAPKTTDRFITIAEAASYLGVTDRTVRNMLYDHRLRAHKLGARIVRLRLSEVDAALEPYGEAVR
ncbi:AlpA family transcriptional regulator [Mycobacterium sp. E1747]|uniref:helix-turn-helix transcriptional regulator n=1 Tax=Mycobacterium sp. E1747 TaxID=1834128 RepID=UPI000800CA92|nr:excisionase family DNA-binding protein [Mycobacterium sp. E1747]OBH12086.1 hypothetical protein A5695_17815 [Mycobacterium sp. E1747]